MWTRASLIEHIEKGGTVDLLLFWGHTQKKPDVVDASCLSQWFPAKFTLDGVLYKTAEHYMMAEKARVFRDEHVRAEILAVSSPKDAKALGRKVKDYNDQAWGKARLPAVIKGNIAKFRQNEAMGRFLLATGDKVLVEASPYDRIWGIGMAASSADAQDPKKWRGNNLLGFALMEARAELSR